MGSTHDTFDPDDIVRVRGKPHLLGTVSLTHSHLDDDDEPLEDLLVLSHTSVPNKELMDFLRTRRPPLGYVFVKFFGPCHGNSLIHENDLELVDRLIGIGQPVKRSPMSPFSGTVISTSVKCSLKPIAYQPVNPRTGDYGLLKFSEKPNGRAAWPSTSNSHDDGPAELHGVPISELTDYEPFSESDYIIYRQKVGRIRSVERDVVLLLSNQKVAALHDVDRLEIPILNDTQNVVAMPDNSNETHMYLLPDGRYVWSSESEVAFPGHYAITSATNMNRHDLETDTSGDVEPEGYVLATRATDYIIDWVCPNVFAVGVPFSSPTAERLGAATVHEHAVKCDFGQLPKDALSNEKAIRADMWLKLGDSVRFRDPSGASQKYSEYRHIPTDESFGYDLNILQITSTKTEVTVQWQDGSITTEDSTRLHTFDQDDEEVFPGNLVVLVDAIESIREPLALSAIPLNIDKSETNVVNYRLKKIGVVQTVDGRERIASVRWYENPDVELTHRGSMMKVGSILGALGSAVTDVSFYEIHRYSCLDLSLEDMVLMVPDTVHAATLPSSTLGASPGAAGPCQMSLVTPSTFFEMFAFLEAMKMNIVRTDWFQNSITIDTSPVPSRFSLRYTEFNVNTPANFFGKVISMDTDGIVTVRLSASNNCRDIRVPLERLMMIIDEEAMLVQSFRSLDLLAASPASGTTHENLHSVLGELPWDFDNPPISHPDDDDGEVDWLLELNTTEKDGEEESELSEEDISENDEDGSDNRDYHEIRGGNENDLEPVAVSDIPPPEPETHEASEDTVDLTEATIHGGSTTQSSSSSACCSPAFALLSGSPPSDHHFINSEPKCSGPLAKRMHKEYGILRSALPSGIVVRVWESRIDLMRVLIIGPQGTPYEYAPFLVDFYFGEDFPNSPPLSFFHSWTDNYGRINPNLYEDGKICLSILGTWAARNPEEGWSAANSTVLQILVSLMGLVLVKAPFYNEAGYEAFAEEGDKQLESAQYTEKAFFMTRKFIRRALENPIAGMEDVLTWYYLPGSQQEGEMRPRLLRRAIDSALEMIEHHNRTAAGEEVSEANVASPYIARLSLGAVVMLRKNITALEHIEARSMADR